VSRRCGACEGVGRARGSGVRRLYHGQEPAAAAGPRPKRTRAGERQCCVAQKYQVTSTASLVPSCLSLGKKTKRAVGRPNLIQWQELINPSASQKQHPFHNGDLTERQGT
jgi:hypothetical protein